MSYEVEKFVPAKREDYDNDVVEFDAELFRQSRCLAPEGQAMDLSGIGGFTIYAYLDGSAITIRNPGSLMGPTVKPNLRGLRYLLAWMDAHLIQ